jgi:hypothetical protein
VGVRPLILDRFSIPADYRLDLLQQLAHETKGPGSNAVDVRGLRKIMQTQAVSAKLRRRGVIAPPAITGRCCARPRASRGTQLDAISF